MVQPIMVSRQSITDIMGQKCAYYFLPSKGGRHSKPFFKVQFIFPTIYLISLVYLNPSAENDLAVLNCQRRNITLPLQLSMNSNAQYLSVFIVLLLLTLSINLDVGFYKLDLLKFTVKNCQRTIQMIIRSVLCTGHSLYLIPL